MLTAAIIRAMDGKSSTLVLRRLSAIVCFLVAVLTLSPTTATRAQQSDVTFFVIGKHASFEQRQAQPEPVDFSFFSEIFLTADSGRANATLTLPGGEAVPFRDMRQASGGQRDDVLLVTGESRYATFDALQDRYPDGRYEVTFHSGSGGPTIEGELTFLERPLPTAPTITVEQSGTDCDVLAAGEDLLVDWTPFENGRPDANEILDDLIFVILENDKGERVAHSGRPFSGDPYLRYNDQGFRIAGDVLEPGRYRLSVEHAMLDDTTTYAGIPAFTTRAVTTRRTLQVAAQTDDTCAAPTQSLTSQVTMFYYDDLDDAARFYGELLGLEKSLDYGWVKFFQTGPASSVGIVQRGSGAWHDPQPQNAVMLSLVTDDVDAWYRRLSVMEGAVVLKELGEGGGIRSFLLEDPGGYTVEFFQWLETPNP